MKAFYFAKKDKRLGYEDNRLVRVGTTHTVDCTPKCCTVGLHGSVKLLDALKYASSNVVYLVDISGDIDEQSDKICGTNRKYLARYDMKRLLLDFSRRQAKINIHLIKPYCTGKEYALINKWLDTGDTSIRSAADSAAYSAAYSAAANAAYSAANAADSAARFAARFAAYSAANAAANAAYFAARFAARFAAYSAANAAYSTADSTADSAAYSTAYSAAYSAANKMLTDMVAKETGWRL